MVAKGDGNVQGCIALVVVLVVLAGTVGAAGTKYEYKTHLSEPGARLDASPGGGPAWVDYDSAGANLLLWGHEGPNDVRLLGRDLATRKVLDLPSAGFSVKGVEWGDNYDRIVVWGSPGAGLNDTLVFYRSPSWSIEEGLLPYGLLPLTEIDHARFFASDIILSVAGRDINGTSRLVVIQMIDKGILRNNLVQNDRSVVHIGSDGRHMMVLDDSGGLIVYRTTDWTEMRQMELLSAPFSSHFIESGNIERIFGGRDGTVATQVDVDRDEWKTFSTGTGPVVGLMFADVLEEQDYIVAAIHEGASSSTLQIWDPMGGGNWTLHRSSTIDGRVSMLAMDPVSNTTIVVAFQDGSVAMYDLILERHEIDDRPSDWWVPYVVIGSLVAIVLVVLIFIMTRRKGGAGGKAE